MECTNTSKSIREIWRDQGLINLSPDYQRNLGVWNEEKKALLVDSVLNGYDIPKFYLHKQDENSPHRWAVVDGKQRLTTLFEFIRGEFPLSKSFVYSGPHLNDGSQVPVRGQRWADLSEPIQTQFWEFALSITEIEADDSRDVNQMFIRLNDGVKLNDAEYRQGFGGQVIWMINQIEEHEFFTKKASFKNRRFEHKDVACRVLFIESTLATHSSLPTLNKTNLDNFTRNFHSLPDYEAELLVKKVNGNLSWIANCFPDRSPELTKSSAQVLYVFLRDLRSEYADDQLQRRVLQTLETMSKERTLQGKLPIEEQDPLVAEYSWLNGQNTNDGDSVLKRAGILRRKLLLLFPEIRSKDKNRNFNSDERYALWLMAEKKCSICGRDLANLSEAHADHIVPHAKGGITSIENGQATCQECNLKKASSV